MHDRFLKPILCCIQTSRVPGMLGRLVFALFLAALAAPRAHAAGGDSTSKIRAELVSVRPEGLNRRLLVRFTATVGTNFTVYFITDTNGDVIRFGTSTVAGQHDQNSVDISREVQGMKAKIAANQKLLRAHPDLSSAELNDILFGEVENLAQKASIGERFSKATAGAGEAALQIGGVQFEKLQNKQKALSNASHKLRMTTPAFLVSTFVLACTIATFQYFIDPNVPMGDAFVKLGMFLTEAPVFYALAERSRAKTLELYPELGSERRLFDIPRDLFNHFLAPKITGCVQLFQGKWDSIRPVRPSEVRDEK